MDRNGTSSAAQYHHELRGGHHVKLRILSIAILFSTLPACFIDNSNGAKSSNEAGSSGSPQTVTANLPTPGPSLKSAPAPTLTSIYPSSGTAAGGSLITLTGTGFQTGATVALGPSKCGSVTFVSATEITCTTPSAFTGTVSVTLTNLDKQTAVLANAFTFLTPNSWQSMSTVNAPSARMLHSAVWTGSKMIVWGGINNSGQTLLNTGGIYDPETDTWTTMSTANAPTARSMHNAFWTGTKMIVWGGVTIPGDSTIPRRTHGLP